MLIGTGGLLAPTIRHHAGTFYIVCTYVPEQGVEIETHNFIISTQDIWSSRWSYPRPLDFHGIDPSLFIDHDGRAYVQGAWLLDPSEKTWSTIKQYEIDLATGQRLSTDRELWSGHAQVYTEGPHIYHKDDWYYLVVAEGGTFEHHMLSASRSRNIWGPYETFSNNPILTSERKPEKLVQDVGHGELFQDVHGLWWAIVLGVRKFGERHSLGRETFLTPVEWPAEDWPRIQHPEASFKRLLPTTCSKWRSTRQDPRVDDCYIRMPNLHDYRWQGNTVEIRASATNLSVSSGTTSFVGKRQRGLNFVASATLSVSPQNLGDSVNAGIAVYKDEFRYAQISFNVRQQEVMVRQRRPIGSNQKQDLILAHSRCLGLPRSSMRLFVRGTAEGYMFGIGGDKMSEEVVLGSFDAADMTCRDFTGPIVGLFATQSSTQNGRDAAWVTFERFEVIHPTGLNESRR
jgi:beta-xylosidase